MAMTQPPVLFVHGIWNTGSAFDVMANVVSSGGARVTRAPSLRPNDGRAPLEELAAQVDRSATTLLQDTRAHKLDVVGFSMGSLVAAYWLQRLGGKQVARRFVSIAGPHAGTYAAWASPRAGARQMRPGSVFLKDLALDHDPFATVEVHTIGTPYDLMIVPSQSTTSVASASSHTWVRTPLHRWLLIDARVITKVVELLDAP